MFYLYLSHNFDYLTNFESMHLWYFQQQQNLHTSKSNTFQNLQSPPHSKRWNMEPYQGLVDLGEGDRDSHTNWLDLVNLRQYTTVTNQS